MDNGMVQPDFEIVVSRSGQEIFIAGIFFGGGDTVDVGLAFDAEGDLSQMAILARIMEDSVHELAASLAKPLPITRKE